MLLMLFRLAKTTLSTVLKLFQLIFIQTKVTCSCRFGFLPACEMTKIRSAPSGKTYCGSHVALLRIDHYPHLHTVIGIAIPPPKLEKKK